MWSTHDISRGGFQVTHHELRLVLVLLELLLRQHVLVVVLLRGELRPVRVP